MTPEETTSGQAAPAPAPATPPPSTPSAGTQNTGTPTVGQAQAQTPETAAADKPPASWDEIFKHPRFKELTEKAGAAAKRLKEYEDAKAAAEEEGAKKRGEFEKLLAKEQGEHAKTRMQLRTTRIGTILRDYLAEKHPEYVAKAKYINPFIEADEKADDEAIAKAVQKAADAWVTDNPVAPRAPGGPAAQPTRGSAQGGLDKEREKELRARFGISG
jgi:hypothetical protein